MRIDPPDAPSVQPPVAHKLDDIAMRHDRRLMHLLVVGQQLLTPAFVPDEELSVHEVMPTHFVAAQQRIELGGIWVSIAAGGISCVCMSRNHLAADSFSPRVLCRLQHARSEPGPKTETQGRAAQLGAALIPPVTLAAPSVKYRIAGRP